MGGQKTRALAKVRHRSLSGAGATALLRVRTTDPLQFVPASDLVGMGKSYFRGIEEYTHGAANVPLRVVNLDTRHGARMCPRAESQVNQHQPLLHAISRTMKAAWGFLAKWKVRSRPPRTDI